MQPCSSLENPLLLLELLLPLALSLPLLELLPPPEYSKPLPELLLTLVLLLLSVTSE
jgi:hypothetical protein